LLLASVCPRHNFAFTKFEIELVYRFEQQVEKKRFKRDSVEPFEDSWNTFFQEPASSSSQQPSKRQIGSLFPGDPMFQEQWHLNRGARGGFDMNVQPAWARGYTGKGVVVSILDDGIQTNHPDLRYDQSKCIFLHDERLRIFIY
jgi:subtilisin family serine protease